MKPTFPVCQEVVHRFRWFCKNSFHQLLHKCLFQTWIDMSIYLYEHTMHVKCRLWKWMSSQISTVESDSYRVTHGVVSGNANSGSQYGTLDTRIYGESVKHVVNWKITVAVYWMRILDHQCVLPLTVKYLWSANTYAYVYIYIYL